MEDVPIGVDILPGVGYNDIENHSQLIGRFWEEKMVRLSEAPHGRQLRIIDIQGGEGVRRRLFALGFHKDDLVEVDSQGILRGPLLIKNLTADTSVAMGRGIAHKIMVETFPDEG